VSFDKISGVVASRVGYTGGKSENPTYQSVCGGDGHTEAMQVDFDTSKLAYGDMIKKFYSEHHYGAKNSKCQYKSAIYYDGPEQEEFAAKSKAALEATGQYVGTDILPLKTWYDAEEYHQKYVQKARSGRGQ